MACCLRSSPQFIRRFKTPHVTTILTGVLVGGIAAFATVDEMVSLTNIGTLFAFILVCVGVIVLRYKDPHRHRAVQSSLGAMASAGSRRGVMCFLDLLPARRIVLALHRLAGAGLCDLPFVRLLAQRDWPEDRPGADHVFVADADGVRIFLDRHGLDDRPSRRRTGRMDSVSRAPDSWKARAPSSASLSWELDCCSRAIGAVIGMSKGSAGVGSFHRSVRSTDVYRSIRQRFERKQPRKKRSRRFLRG